MYSDMNYSDSFPSVNPPLCFHFKRIPAGAVGMYSYYDRLAVGLRQLMAGTSGVIIELDSHLDSWVVATLTKKQTSL